uniref:GOLD domain-containing protein n=1 Tax=Neobodo designis TaxID=312471 RepID=A0A7S1QFY4_NEODS|mmetsp:Transcript_41894/g.129510  ORF Transcript_41894/g.129510 Transcript_41894/m.129510 type:complete len:215 (+) Transcript_41894:73-717(+)|eukprot:CAMPEP_0174853336 /NCGR_PEP_ID=MMETSP1114-20130205/27984_1 /TAXON_ID=312471 /ORGANISM="Neobodo designis, Strain CCAP 1951/1" /LENGTH=214 /DNA_ID=CAMNT_0016087971 /DNA_START=73 /DNA_END=717 /DNA_ORIENTATION=+
MSRAAASVMCIALVLLLVAASCVEGFVFHLPARSYRCFTEEVPTGVEANVSYAALPGYGQYVDVKVTDPTNRVVHEDTAMDKGSFLIPAANGGEYAVCFYSRLVPGLTATEGMHRAVRLNFNAAQDEYDYAALASEKHMKPMEVHLRVAEDTVRGLHAEYEYFKERENQMRATQEHMNNKVSVLSVGVLVGFALFTWWQVRHLTKYFRRKRMLD